MADLSKEKVSIATRGLSACLPAWLQALRAFNEASEPAGHVGVDASCYPTGQALVVVGLVASLVTLLVLMLTCCLASRQRRQQQQLGVLCVGGSDEGGGLQQQQQQCGWCPTDACPPGLRAAAAGSRSDGGGSSSRRPNRWRRGERYELIDSQSDEEES